MTDAELRKTIGGLFEAAPELTEATLTISGTRYRARRAGPWLLLDVKSQGRGWTPWGELRKRVTA